MANGYSNRIEGMTDNYQPGTDADAFGEQLKAELDAEELDSSKVENIEDPDLKEYAITDEKVQRQRAQQSRELRHMLVDAYCASLKRPKCKLESTMVRAHRAICHYYMSIGQPEKIDEFEKLFAASAPAKDRLAALQANGMTAEQAEAEIKRQNEEVAYRRGKWLADVVDQFRHIKPEDCTNRSLKYVTEHFAELNFIYALTMNMEPSVRSNGDPEIKYTPEDYERTKFILDIYAPLGSCITQAYAAANPYYALFDAEACMEEVSDPATKCVMPGMREESVFGDMLADIGLSALQMRSGGAYAIKEQLRANGIDPKKAKYEMLDGEPLKMDELDGQDYISNGNAVYVTEGSKQMLVRVDTPEKDQPWDVHVNETPAELFNIGHTASMSRLSRLVSDADPFYIRSSQQFRTMKHTLSKLTKLGAMSSSVDDVSEAQRQEIVDTVKKLEEDCRSYLDFKGTEGKNDLERRRIAAVQEVLDYAHLQNGIWERANVLHQRLEAAQRADNPMQEVQDAKKFMTQGLACADIPANGNARLEEVNNSIRKAFDEDRDKTYECVDPHKGAPTDRLEGEQLKTAQNIVEMMTIKAMLVNDQANQRAKNEPHKPGPIDKVFNQVTVLQFRHFIESTPEFQNTMNNMTREGMFKFVTEGGARKLAQDIVTAIVDKAHTDYHASAEAQMAKNGLEVQKQSGRSK